MANFFGKIYNLFRQPIRQTNLTFEKYIPYFGGLDNFPLQWHQAISESPSATACVSTIQDFLEGFGFSDPQLEKLVVNYKGETFFQIHQKVCKDYGEFEGFALRVMYSGDGRISEILHLPFENVRLGKPDSKGFIAKILYNPFFGTADYQQNKNSTEFDSYNPKNVKAQMLEQGEMYKGQVLFVGTTNALSRFYPMPEAHASIKWFKIEAGVSDYHEDNINNGFLQPFMLAMIGDPNAPINNPEGSDTTEVKTQGEAFDELIEENFMGAKRVGNMWVQWFSNKDEVPIAIPMPSNNNGDLFVTVDNQATKKITIAFKVPAILANINEGVSLGGDGNMVRVAVKLMQQRVIKKQRVLTDTYQMLLKNFTTPYTQEITIAPYNPYPELEVIDDKIWAEMSPEDRKSWIEKNTEIVLQDEVLPTAPPTQARLTNAIPVAFPESVRESVKKALDYNDKMGIKCISNSSRLVSESIINNQNLGFKQLKRLHNYLKARPQFANSAYKDGCEVIKYAAWGGKDMESFLEAKLNEFDKWLN